MDKKNRKAPARPQKEITVSFRASPSDVEAWRHLADKDDRALSSWVRRQLNAAKAEAESDGQRSSEKDQNNPRQRTAKDK